MSSATRITTMTERSRAAPPTRTGGSTLRTGRNTGSVMASSTRTTVARAEPWSDMGNQLSRARATSKTT